jgi:hypothetical protein
MLLLNKNRIIGFPQIYFGLLLGMAVSLPLSKALMSIFPGLLLANWIIEGQFPLKVQRLRERKSLLLLISVFLVYLLGILWTNSLKWGLHDIKIQLPFLVLPLVIGTSDALNYKQVKQLIYVFSAAVIAASFCSIFVLLGFSAKQIHDPRQMSLFISHIRFALLINISIFSMGWYLLNSEIKSFAEKGLLTTAIIWLSVFLVILESATGWVVFLVVLASILSGAIFRIRKMIWRAAFFVVLVSILLLPAIYIGYIVHQFYNIEQIPQNINSLKTSRGNLYSNELDNYQLENGHYAFLYIAADELRDAWNMRSKINYDSTSANGYNKYILIRYMTSKGLRKDFDGVSQLTDRDIQNIENGMTNFRFENPMSFYSRIYKIVWEIDTYRKGGNPSGHSVTQRLEYYKMAIQIINEHFWFGNGTGGYYEAYQAKYNQNKFFRENEYRQRSHNMFLSYWIDFGLIGMCYICFALAAPVFLECKTKSYLLMVFLLIVLISFMNEDTLNNHDAISFFAFFYPLFLYSKHETHNPEHETK